MNDLRTLVVDDEVASIDATCELLMLIRMRQQPAEGAAQALNTLDGNDVDVVFTDVVMPDIRHRTGATRVRHPSATQDHFRFGQRCARERGARPRMVGAV
ncbi:hypothetical protein [uncultured Paraburkholderia sp.]|uniref:hypothetical protein n=1 Tax=uncultured Paraburkholderia sp. TaxID=1822466 RepID=UPI002597D4CB|nr:hypothetical protein [uncultured Paraburkholderia sp.]